MSTQIRLYVFTFAILSGLIAATPSVAVAGYYCTVHDTNLYCRPEDRPAFWCTSNEPNKKFCRPADRRPYWCVGKGALTCRPKDGPRFWCVVSDDDYYCRD